MVIYGTRPEAIKVAPLITELKYHPGFEPVVVVTGQHREMLDQVNRLFEIKPEIDLDLMIPGASLSSLSTRALAAVTQALETSRPDVVVVQGDTSTAFIGALAAFYQQIPVVHLEAGLRTWNLSSPFPEEGNRQLIGRIADLHLAPTATSRENLVREGVAPDSIAITGNTVIDALLDAVSVPLEFAEDDVAKLVAGGEKYVLVTAHRRESWGDPMREAMTAIRNTAKTHPDLRWLVPMHRNPLVRDVIQDELGSVSQAILCEPLTYHEFCHAMRSCYLVLTDSGGVQEEAPSLGKPVLVMRGNTERPEAVTAGTVKLVGTEREIIEAELGRLLDDPVAYESMANAVNPYGDGGAARRCVAALEHFFGIGDRLPDFVPTS